MRYINYKMSNHSYIVKLKIEGDDESLKEAYKHNY